MKIATRCMRALQLSPEISVECQKEYGHAGPHSHALKEPYGVMYWEDDKLPPPSPPDDIGTLEYKGNSVSYIYDKMRAYGKCITDCWDVMRRHGIKADGETDIVDVLDKHLPKTPPAEVPEVEPESMEVMALEHPKILGYCAKWPLKVGKKPERSCKGCTVTGCKAKGKVQPKNDCAHLGEFNSCSAPESDGDTCPCEGDEAQECNEYQEREKR